MTGPTATPSPSFGQRVARFVAHLLRMVLWTLFLLAILAGLAALIGWGIPYIDRHILQPLQDVQARLAHLEDAHATLSERVRANEDRLDTINTQLNQVTMTQRDLMHEMQAIKAQLDTLTGQQSSLQSQVEDLQAQVATLEQALEQMDALTQDLAQVSETAATAQTQWTVNRALLHLAQARLALAQEDWRLAQEEIGRAATALHALRAQTDDPAVRATLDEAQTRLRLAYDKALTAPDIAARDVDVVWTLLQQAFPPPGAAESPTDALLPATPEAPAAPTPTPTPTSTPTP